MKNKYLKKWKKTHRQRRKAKMSYITFTLSEEYVEKLKEYCKKCHISFTQGIHRCLHRAIEKFKMEGLDEFKRI